jgi:hypothetical protein
MGLGVAALAWRRRRGALTLIRRFGSAANLNATFTACVGRHVLEATPSVHALVMTG